MAEVVAAAVIAPAQPMVTDILAVDTVATAAIDPARLNATARFAVDTVETAAMVPSRSFAASRFAAIDETAVIVSLNGIDFASVPVVEAIAVELAVPKSTDVPSPSSSTPNGAPPIGLELIAILPSRILHSGIYE
jgi:hypothetical protein